METSIENQFVNNVCHALSCMVGKDPDEVLSHDDEERKMRILKKAEIFGIDRVDMRNLITEGINCPFLNYKYTCFLKTF